MGVKHETIEANDSGNPFLLDIIAESAARRRFLKGGGGLAALGFFGGVLPSLQPLDASASGPAALVPPTPTFGGIDFTGISVSNLDTIRVPDGYSVQVLYKFGDPIGHPSQAAGQPAPNVGFATPAQMELQSGAHHDGMHYFGFAQRGSNLPSSTRGLLCVNHEYVDDNITSDGGLTTYVNDDITTTRIASIDPTPVKIKRSQAAHGVSVIEVQRLANGTMQVRRPSPYARRLTCTQSTLCDLNGPARGDALLRTTYASPTADTPPSDPTGTQVYGTLNNCAHGYTPWGTYLTCEENFRGYFGTPASGVSAGAVTYAAASPSIAALESRYQMTRGGFGYLWPNVDKRFDINHAGARNEYNKFGWVVEVDPFDPARRPVKRTSMGRYAHEGCWPVVAADGRVAFYSGDDDRGEYIYKFVTAQAWSQTNRAANRNLLDNGTLYVMRCNPADSGDGDARGTGVWVPLLPSTELFPAVARQGGGNATLADAITGYTRADGTVVAPRAAAADLANRQTAAGQQAWICIYTRVAADLAGATKMDRPEWISAHPSTREMYITLTNNRGRGVAGAQQERAPIDDANPRLRNNHGHILRWREAGADSAATSFEYDVFIMAGNSQDIFNDGDTTNDASATPSDALNPTGAEPDLRPRWTPALLAHINGDPKDPGFSAPDGIWFDRHGRLWVHTDVSTEVQQKLVTIQGQQVDYTQIGNNQTLVAYVGEIGDPNRAATQVIRRFLTGPVGQELCGIDQTPDGRTLFITVQHPGEPIIAGVDDVDPTKPGQFSNWPRTDADFRAASDATPLPPVDLQRRPLSAVVVVTRNDGGIVGGPALGSSV
jgi:secreted PhoX family phosphatase